MTNISLRPTPWSLPPEGFHYEVASSESMDWRLATKAESETRICRHSTRHKCRNKPAAALLRGVAKSAWWFYCADHMYGRWIEDGTVMHWRLVKDETP